MDKNQLKNLLIVVFREQDIKLISEWLKSIKIHFIIFNNRNASKSELQFSIDGQSVNETGHTKFLGVITDSRLNWKNHILHITESIARGIGVITKARKLPDKLSLTTLYYAFIYVYMCYCNHVG